MPFKLEFKCFCNTSLSMGLSDAQKHADETGHAVRITGTVTPSEQVADLKKIEISDRLKRRLHEEAVMRAARDKGLLPGDKKHVRGHRP